MEKVEGAFLADRIGQLTMRNLDIQDTRSKLGIYRKSHALVWVQNPLRLGDLSEPEPDLMLMLMKPRADLYADSHATAADVLLLIEVADASARATTARSSCRCTRGTACPRSGWSISKRECCVCIAVKVAMRSTGRAPASGPSAVAGERRLPSIWHARPGATRAEKADHQKVGI